MNRRPKPSSIIVPLLFLAAFLVAWVYAAHRKESLSLPESGALLVLRPAQYSLIHVGGWFGDLGRTMFRRGSIVDENRRLKESLALVQAQNEGLLRYRRENSDLRRLLAMPPPEKGRYISADVVSLDATDYARRIIIDVGGGQGVRPKDVVMAPQGLVGQVVETAPHFGASTILLLTDRQSAVGAMTSRRQAKGILQGTGDRLCKMSYLDFDADVREGDLVVTSGDSTIFPRGLVLGKVVKVEKDKTYSQMTAIVEPAVPFNELSAVQVRVQAGP